MRTPCKMLWRVALPAVIFGLCGIAPLEAGPLTLGTNWIYNGDAEAGTGSTDGSVVSVPGWNVFASDMFTSVQYGAFSGGPFPAASESSPLNPNPGLNFFAGGPNVNAAAGYQQLDVSAFASQIDAGQLSFVLSAYLGGWQNQNDYAEFWVAFLDNTNQQFDQTVIAGPDAAARGNNTQMVLTSTAGIIPVGTRTLQFAIDLHRLNGSYDDGYADNLSFVATASASDPANVPEPATAGLIALGGAGLAAFTRLRGTRRRI